MGVFHRGLQDHPNAQLRPLVMSDPGPPAAEELGGDFLDGLWVVEGFAKDLRQPSLDPGETKGEPAWKPLLAR